MNNDAIRLSILFFEYIKGFQRDARGKILANDGYKNKVLASTEALLAGGMNVGLLEDMIKKYRDSHPTPQDAYNIEDILKFSNVTPQKGMVKQDPDNLIEAGKFYRHPQLQVAPPPPMIEILPDGTFKSSYEEEEFFLEIKSRYTFDELVDYFYYRVGPTEFPREKERDKGAFKHLLKTYDIDLLLYMIDESVIASLDMNRGLPKAPFDITDYVQEAMGVLEDRKNTLFMEGLDHVIPRTR